MSAAAPLDDWYFEHILAWSEPDGHRAGPVRMRQADWAVMAEALRDETAGTYLHAAVEVALRQGFVLTNAQARQCNLSDADVRRLVSRGAWSKPRYGVLSPLPGTPVLPARSRAARSVQPHGHAVQVQAAAAALIRPHTSISHEAGAATFGLPLLDPPQRPTLSAVSDARVVSRKDVIVRGVGLGRDDVTTWFGAPVCRLDRTIMDVARSSGTPSALAMADAALNDRLTTSSRLRTARTKSSYRPGIRAADRVLELADGRAESPLESLVRLTLADGGLPTPELQAVVQTGRGTYRVDMLFRQARVIVEVDGELKYDPWCDPDALLKEKRRQEALEQAGFRVIRVTWWEIQREPARVIWRVQRWL